MNKKKIILIVIVILSILLMLIFSNKKLTKLEQIKMEEIKNEYLMFFEDIEGIETESIDKYISYALDYSYNFNEKNTLSTKEIKDIVEKIFDIKLDEEQINQVGISPLLLDKNISHNPELKEYTLNYGNVTQPMIAEIPIVVYKTEKITKRGKKYKAVYTKYIINNPYDILNYYNDLYDQNKEEYNTKDIMNYLTAKGKISSIKKAVNDDIIKKYAVKDKKIKVTYIITNDEIKIQKLK